MPVCAREAHPGTCFVADPRGYAYTFLVVPTVTAVETASATRAQGAQTGREKHLKNASCELHQIYEWSIQSPVYQSCG